MPSETRIETTEPKQEQRLVARQLAGGVGCVEGPIAAALAAEAAPLREEIERLTNEHEAEAERLDRLLQERDAEIERLTKERDEAKFAPLGDNHHNAAKCPHCGDPLRAAEAKVLSLEAEIEKLKAAAPLFKCAGVDWHLKTADERDAAKAQALTLEKQLAEARKASEASRLPPCQPAFLSCSGGGCIAFCDCVVQFLLLVGREKAAVSIFDGDADETELQIADARHTLRTGLVKSLGDVAAAQRNDAERIRALAPPAAESQENQQQPSDASVIARWEALHEGHTIDCEEAHHKEDAPADCICKVNS